MSRLFAIALLAALVAGCSSAASWHNPSYTPAQRDADLTDCRRSAESDMGAQANTAPGSDKFDSPMQMVDRSDMRSHFSALVADCMERKGYTRTP